MAERIKLSADYQCWPLWRPSGDDVDPHTLPLSTETIERLERWADTYDGWLDLSDPARSPTPSPKEKRAFEQEGRRLWKRLRQELGPDYEVVYHSETEGLLTEPDPGEDDPS